MGYLNKLTQAAQPAQTPTTLAAPMTAQETKTAPNAAVPAADHVADQMQDGPKVPASKALPLEPSAPKPDDDAVRRVHEAAEAKRKAEWEAKQAAKKAARQAQLDRIKAMNDADLLAASVSRVRADTEKLTRRNMKEAVAEHIQARCREDAAFARLVMDPDKSMINCFKYINRRAQQLAEREMKDNGIERTGVYGLDVPDGLCFQWAVDYFNDPDAKEDKENEERFTPRPYIPKASGSKSVAKAKSQPKKETPKPAPKPQPKVDGQLSFMEAAG